VNPLRRALTGSGELPAPLRAELDAEGLLLLEETLPGSITFRHYRAPGRRDSLRKVAISGAIAVTAGRLVVCVRASKHIDVSRSGPLWSAIEVAVDKPGRVCFAYDAAAFSTERSGRVEVRLCTEQAARVVELLS